MSRLSELKILNRKMTLPVINNGYYLITYVEEMGYCTNTGDKTAPLTFQEINAWNQSAGLELTHNEKLHMKRLSDSFVSALNESGQKGAMPYYSNEKSDVSGKLRNAFSVLNKK